MRSTSAASRTSSAEIPIRPPLTKSLTPTRYSCVLTFTLGRFIVYTEEDRRRLLESRHDISAVDKPVTLTPHANFQLAIVASRDELAQERVALQSAAARVAREHSETDAERAKLAESVAALVRRYAFVRGKVQDALLNVDPDVVVNATELERRKRLVDRTFSLSQSDIERLGQGAIIEIVGTVVEALETEPDLKPLGYGTSFMAIHNAAKSDAHEFGRENNEDAQAMTSLRNARAGFDRATNAHTLLVESILVRHNRKDEIGQFILSRNAAYAARRAARVPVTEEPGGDDVDTLLPAATET